MHRDTAKRAFSGIVVEGQAAIIEAADEPAPSRAHVAKGRRQLGLAGQLWQRGFSPALQGIGDGYSFGLPSSSAFSGRHAVESLVEGIKGTDTVQSLFGDRRSVGGM